MIYYKYYTGIGSTKTPEKYLKIFEILATKLSNEGFVLRSGGAPGADSSFELGSSLSMREIYLPWSGFQGKYIDNKQYFLGVSDKSLKLAEKYHPAWNNCSPGAKKLHARNCHQILGKNLDSLSSLVICWTKGGKFVGGTSQALRIAKDFGIPIINFGKNEYANIDDNKLISLTLKYVKNLVDESVSNC